MSGRFRCQKELAKRLLTLFDNNYKFNHFMFEQLLDTIVDLDIIIDLGHYNDKYSDKIRGTLFMLILDKCYYKWDCYFWDKNYGVRDTVTDKIIKMMLKYKITFEKQFIETTNTQLNYYSFTRLPIKFSDTIDKWLPIFFKKGMDVNSEIVIIRRKVTKENVDPFSNVQLQINKDIRNDNLFNNEFKYDKKITTNWLSITEKRKLDKKICILMTNIVVRSLNLPDPEGQIRDFQHHYKEQLNSLDKFSNLLKRYGAKCIRYPSDYEINNIYQRIKNNNNSIMEQYSGI
jgi:hypothetical protein